MKNKLFDFQEGALEKLLQKLFEARKEVSVKSPRAISFSAPTGAGKTIVMTALFENLLYGLSEPEERDAPAILWVSDMPELNEQTRLKIENKSERIRVKQLVTIDSAFDQEILSGNRIYFINVQKLGNDKKLTRKGDSRHYTIWETLNNTAQKMPKSFYVVIDEAHRGMYRGISDKRAQTIIQKFLLGSDEDNLCVMPLVIGISATPERFYRLLEKTDYTISRVDIHSGDVRDSGLLKDNIVIHHPKSAAEADMTLLSRAVVCWQNFYNRWSSYCQSQKEKKIKPILVIQVEDGTKTKLTKTDLSAILKTIEEAMDRKLKEGEVAHNFVDSADIKIGGYTVRHVDASRIEENSQIGVVLFKMSLSTGWDCPRAEVMMSFRRAKDHTYIAQLLGRMVRTPLTKRVTTDTGLNSVHLYLPRYDQITVKSIIDDLENAENIPSMKPIFARQTVDLRRKSGLEPIFSQMSLLPINRVGPTTKQNAIRRTISLAWLVTHYDIDKKAHKAAVQSMLAEISKEINRLRDSGALRQVLDNIMNLEVIIHRVGKNSSQSEGKTEKYTTPVSLDDMDRIFDNAGRRLGHGLHIESWKQACQDNPKKDLELIKAEIIALVHNQESMEHLEKFAEEQFDLIYDSCKHRLREINDSQFNEIEKLRLTARSVLSSDWRIPKIIDFSLSEKASEYDKHLFLEENGTFRCDLGNWEESVIREELDDPTTIGWLRNLDRKLWSFSIGYECAGKMLPMFPDFLVVRKRKEGCVFDILEPHSPRLDDNVAKAKGLAKFAQEHSRHFGRIELIRKEPNGGLLRLAINKQTIRKRILSLVENDQNSLDKIFKEEARERKAILK